MNADKKTSLLYSDLTYKIRKAIFNVYNQLGFGHKENVYHKSLKIEFTKLRLDFEEEKLLAVKYRKQIVGYYKPDFVVENKILVEIKAVPFLPGSAETQVLNYIKGTGFKLGILVNFGAEKLYISRKIWSSYYR